VNVNKIRAFEEIRRHELMMERQAMQKAPGGGPAGMHGGLWRRPAPISDLPAAVTPGVHSTERDTQARREQAVLQALYFTKEMIPDSATEPDDSAPAAGDYDEPKLIPLHDVSARRMRGTGEGGGGGDGVWCFEAYSGQLC
jgi:protein phosphatase 1 regulatory subunit 10